MTNDFHKNKNLVMKHVRYHNLTEKLILLDPNIKIIGLIRNPYSVISSQMSANKEKLIDWKNGTDKNNNKDEEYFGINKWQAFNNDIQLLKKKYPKNVYIVKYENLYDNLESEMKKLSIFCDINYQKDLNHTLIKKTSDIINSENYDYSIFNRPRTVSQIKSSLDSDIINYIKNLPIDF
jgi:hypothetical protein